MWDWGAFLHYLHSPYLLKGAGLTLVLSVAAMALGLACGLAAALLRLSPLWMLRQPAAFYVWIMRGTPALVQLIIIYTGRNACDRDAPATRAPALTCPGAAPLALSIPARSIAVQPFRRAPSGGD